MPTKSDRNAQVDFGLSFWDMYYNSLFKEVARVYSESRIVVILSGIYKNLHRLI